MTSNTKTASEDKYLPMLTPKTANIFRAMAQDVLAELGIETTIINGQVVADDGQKFGLENIAAHCKTKVDKKHWRPTLVEYFTTMLHAVPQHGLRDFSPEQIRANTYLRLAPHGAGTQLGEKIAGETQWQPGVSQLLCQHFPPAIMMASESELAQFAPIKELVNQGRANLRAALLKTNFTTRRFSHNRNWVTEVESESFLTASFALLMPEFIAQLEPKADISKGIVFAIPTRHQFMYRVVTNSESVDHSTAILPQLAANDYHTQPNQLSPFTYYWRDGEVTQISVIPAPGVCVALLPPQLEAIAGPQIRKGVLV